MPRAEERNRAKASSLGQGPPDHMQEVRQGSGHGTEAPRSPLFEVFGVGGGKAAQPHMQRPWGGGKELHGEAGGPG
jgi:hypothetical protein